MYAVVKTGGKQYRVSAGETIQVEIAGNGIRTACDQDPIRLSIPRVVGVIRGTSAGGGGLPDLAGPDQNRDLAIIPLLKKGLQ